MLAHLGPIDNNVSSDINNDEMAKQHPGTPPNVLHKRLHKLPPASFPLVQGLCETFAQTYSAQKLSIAQRLHKRAHNFSQELSKLSSKARLLVVVSKKDPRWPSKSVEAGVAVP
jgi:hypothetical protein